MSSPVVCPFPTSDIRFSRRPNIHASICRARLTAETFPVDMTVRSMVRLSARERSMRRRDCRIPSSMKPLVFRLAFLSLTGLLIGLSWIRRDAKPNLGSIQRKRLRRKLPRNQSMRLPSRYRLCRMSGDSFSTDSEKVIQRYRRVTAMTLYAALQEPASAVGSRETPSNSAYIVLHRKNAKTDVLMRRNTRKRFIALLTVRHCDSAEPGLAGKRMDILSLNYRLSPVINCCLNVPGRFLTDCRRQNGTNDLVRLWTGRRIPLISNSRGIGKKYRGAGQ